MLWKDLDWHKNNTGDWYADIQLGDGTWLQVYKAVKLPGYGLFHDEEQYIWDNGSDKEPPALDDWQNLEPLQVMCLIHELRNKFGD